MSEQEEEKDYEATDKLDENSEAHVTSEEEEQYRQMMADMPPVDIYSLLKSFVAMLGAQTWQWLGLMKNQATGNIEKDLSQAKVAIDTIALLVGQLEPKLDPSELREMQRILSDLRINYVQQSAK